MTANRSARIFLPALALGALLLLSASFAEASHAWGPYHWARTANPFTLNLGDNVGTAWDAYLATASADWSADPGVLYPGKGVGKVLGTTVVAGNGTRNCQATSGTVQVCNKTYGNNGWLGIASIWISGTHITQGTVKLNDTYFNTSTYNKPAWRNMVMCQEIGHTFGLDHQDTNFYNANLGTCMDYTNDPARNDGAGDNKHPNFHDYEELSIMYGHFDSFNSFKVLAASKGSAASAASGDIDTSDRKEWGRAIRTSRDGRESLFESVQANGDTIYTFVIWANESTPRDRGEREERGGRN